jgi:hypothetical protein
MKKLMVVAVALVGCSLAVWAQGVRRDGRWEVKSEMSMSGMNMQMPATTMTQCITKEEADDPQKQAVPQGRGGASSDCKITDFKVDGNKVTYKMNCTSPQAVTGDAEMNYTVDAYTGTMTLQMARGGQQMTMINKMTGKRLGDCVK